VNRPLLTRVRELAGGRKQQPEPRTGLEEQSQYVCHCKHVDYLTVEKAISRGASSIGDIQRKTSACTRCFGCRFELEGMLRAAYGDSYRHETTITLPDKLAKARLPRPMYMPVLAGFGGNAVDTRVIVFNLEGPDRPVAFRADLTTMAGERVQALEHTVARGASAVLDYSREAVGELLPDGVGVVKLVLETEEVGSLRPYFHFVTETGVTSTHEKKGPSKPQKQEDRSYHWIFPVGAAERDDEAYFFCTNTQTAPMTGQQLVWTSNTGVTEAAGLPTLEFGQSACVPLHEELPLFQSGEGGAVRLEPATHAIAGFLIRHEPERQLWRVQHL
jgi:bacterioferritin-associated ferredoxin